MTDLIDQQRALIGGRFELHDKLGEGGQGIAWRAMDTNTGETVVVKELAVGKVTDWKAIELFEREGQALAALDHPAIPRYVATLHLDADDAPGQELYLVQQYVAGRDFGELIDQGHRMTEGQAREFLADMLQILGYIHSLDPPVVHRDIKPSNIIRRPDGELALVDFGAAQTVVSPETGGSTVVGTSGYMPIEQMQGRAQPATDLYGLGATVVHLLSHVHPSELDVEMMRLKFRDRVNVSDGLCDFLERMLEPHVEDRFQTAGEALAALEKVDARAQYVEQPDRQPAAPKALDDTDADDELPASGPRLPGVADLGPPEEPFETDIKLKRDPDLLQIYIPRAGFTGKARSTAFVALLINAISLPVFFLMVGETVMGEAGLGGACGIVFMLIFVGFGGYLTWLAFKRIFAKVRINVDGQFLEFKEKLLFRTNVRQVALDDIIDLDMKMTESQNGEEFYQLAFHMPFGSIAFASARTTEEQHWLAAHLRDFIEEHSDQR